MRKADGLLPKGKKETDQPIAVKNRSCTNCVVVAESEGGENCRLEDSAKTDKKAYEVEIQRQREQDKLLKELTARCSALEKSKRKLESELEERVSETVETTFFYG